MGEPGLRVDVLAAGSDCEPMNGFNAATREDEPARYRGIGSEPTEPVSRKYAWMSVGTTGGREALG